jgi:hypothetical protein
MAKGPMRRTEASRGRSWASALDPGKRCSRGWMGRGGSNEAPTSLTRAGTVTVCKWHRAIAWNYCGCAAKQQTCWSGITSASAEHQPAAKQSQGSWVVWHLLEQCQESPSVGQGRPGNSLSQQRRGGALSVLSP